jgi:hypothetical protein
MKENFQRWLEEKTPVPGVLACGVRFTDKSSVTQSWSAEYPTEALENTWRCVADTFQVLKLNRLPGDRVLWVYEQALLYSDRRADGICLGVFIQRVADAVDQAGLETLFSEFAALEAVGRE